MTTEQASARSLRPPRTTNPLTPKAPVQQKTRFSDRAATEKADKAAAKATKAKDKAAIHASSDDRRREGCGKYPGRTSGPQRRHREEEKEDQSAKGAPKERMQDKDKQAPVAAPAPEPTVNPALWRSPWQLLTPAAGNTRTGTNDTSTSSTSTSKLIQPKITTTRGPRLSRCRLWPPREQGILESNERLLYRRRGEV